MTKCWRRCGEKGTLLHCWWECKLVKPLWRTVWRFLKKLKIELPYNPAIPLLGIYPEKNMAWKDMHCNVHCSTVYNSETWKQPRCLSTEKRIKKMWYIHAMEYYSAIKKEIMPFAATWMTRECHTEWSKSDREGEIAYDMPSMWNQKRNNPSCKIERDSTNLENELMVAREGRDS